MRHTVALSVIVLAVVSGCSPSAAGSADAPAATAAGPTRALSQARMATGDSAMIVSASPLATNAGLEVLRQGGNAVDAAVTVALTLAVTYPAAGNIGGGGFMVARIDGKHVALGTGVGGRSLRSTSEVRDAAVERTGAPAIELAEGWRRDTKASDHVRYYAAEASPPLMM